MGRVFAILTNHDARVLEVNVEVTHDPGGQTVPDESSELEAVLVTLIDDAPAGKNWHSAIGSCAYWPGKPKIPGPVGVGHGINVVNLYVLKNGFRGIIGKLDKTRHSVLSSYKQNYIDFN